MFALRCLKIDSNTMVFFINGKNHCVEVPQMSYLFKAFVEHWIDNY